MKTQKSCLYLHFECLRRKMNQETQDFIRHHQDDDVRQLAFLGSKFPKIDMPFALDQIRGRQMARAKLPRWASIDGIVYPPHISMEQCSSETTAMYKADLAARLLKSKICEFPTECAVDSKFAQNGGTCDLQEKIDFVDLTGGFGVDFSYIAARLGVKAMYVERQVHLCEVAKENFECLGLENVMVQNGDGIDVLHSIPSCCLIYVDPARRDGAGNKVVSLHDCTPDVSLLQDEMLDKSDFVIIKLSPMLDWHRAVDELKHVREVHIVSTGNECKELLLVLSKSSKEPSLKFFCVNDSQKISYEIENGSSEAILIEPTADYANQYLYEPNASVMKAGCFGLISAQYGIKKLAKNSHLFVSDRMVNNFPGRSFHIKATSSFNKKELKLRLQGIEKANIATRNFPLSVAELRKRLKLKDGGDTYIFATTQTDGSHIIFICDKM